MEITLDKQGAYGLVKIQLVKDDYKAELEKQLKDYQKKANLKGFRPGKAPLGFIQKMVGKDMKADLVSRKVSESINNYLKDNEVEILFSPLPKDEPLTLEDFAAKDAFSFEFELCVEPEFNYSLSKDFKVTSYKIEPKEEEINDVVAKIRKDTPKIVQAEEVGEGDFVKGNFKLVEGDFEKETVLPLNQVPEEHRALFLGKEKDAPFTFDLRAVFPEANTLKMLFADEQEIDFDALSGDVELTITEISREEESDLDAEFFQKALGKEGIETEEAFREELQKIITDGNANVSNDLTVRELRDKLVADTEMEFPEDFIKKVMKMSREEQGGMSDEELEKQLPSFKDALKWRVISNKIFKDAELKIEQEEVVAAARRATKQSLLQMGLANLPEEQMEQFVDMMLEREESRNKSMEDGYEMLFLEKLTDHIKGQITLDEKAVGIEEFKAIVEEITKKDQEEVAAEQTEEVEA